MADITYAQFQELFNQFVRNFDNSDRNRANSLKMDKTIDALNQVRADIQKNTEAFLTNGQIDYDKLSAAIVSGMKQSSAGSGSASPPQRETPTQSVQTQTPSQRPQQTSSNRRAGSFLDQMYNGFRNNTDAVNENSSAQKGLGAEARTASGAFSKFSSALSKLGVFELVTKLINGSVSAIEDRADAYRTLSRNGSAFSGDILQMSRTIHSSGLSFDAFTKAMTNASQGLKILGPESFARLSAGLQDANIKIGDLGLTLDDQNQQLSYYTERLRVSGTLTGMTTDGLVDSFRSVIQTSTSLASAVGTSRDSILKAADAINSSVQNRALLQMDSGVGGQNVTQLLSAISNAYGGGETGTRIANAILRAAHNQYNQDTQVVMQQLGPAVQTLISGAREALNSQTLLTGQQLARLAEPGINQSREYARATPREGLVAASLQGNSYATQAINIQTAATSASLRSDRAEQADRAQTEKTSATQGALALAQTRQQVEAVKQATATAALTQIQYTLGASLKTYDQAINDGTKAVINHVGNFKGNSWIDSGTGNLIDRGGGRVIDLLNQYQGAISTAIEGMIVLGSIKGGLLVSSLRGLVRGIGSVVRSLRGTSSVVSSAGSAIKAVTSGRGGLLGRIASMASRGGVLAEAASTGTTFLGTTAAGAIGTVGSAVGGIAYGAYRNYDSTKRHERGEISDKQNDINHAGNYGIMGGAVAGAATGALIGSVVPVIGTAIGGALGGILGGYLGYEAGDHIGQRLYKNESDVVRNPVSTNSLPSIPHDQQQDQKDASENADTATHKPRTLEDEIKDLRDQVSVLTDVMKHFGNINVQHLASIERNTGETIRQVKKSSNTIA